MSSALDNPEPGPAENASASKPSIPDYELLRVVGRGSYGDVWLARSITGAWRAIKVVWRERFTNPEPFEREFRGLKEFADISLGESSQMTLLHVGRNDVAGFFYYVMELADDAERGRHIDPASYVPLTLAELRTRRGRIAADECARFGVELARVLASLHRRGLVHRDVKPSNVILVSGVPKLADVGLVAPTAIAHTFVGTEGYVPPEGPGAPSADVFALGKMLYELSTGHDRQEFPKLPADLARLPDRAALLELNEIFLRACGPTPAERYRDGAAVLADLTALNRGVSLRTRRFTAFVLRAAASVAVAAALGWGVWYWQTRPVPIPMPIAAGIFADSVAVLPFVNVSGNSDEEYFSDGISDEILHALERERDLRVTGSWSSFWFKERKIPAVEIAKRLRVAQLVEGSMQRVGSRIRLDVRLTRGADGVSENIGTFERAETEVFALEDEVARAVAQKILRRVSMPALQPSTKNHGAYREFLWGRALQLRGAAQAAEAAKHFRRACDLDPNFAVAWARLADALRTDGTKAVHGVWDYTVALPAVERALEIQPDLALAWTVRGFIRGVGTPAGGLLDLSRAEELGGPNAETRLSRFILTWFAGEAQGLLPLAREAIVSNPENIERVSAVAGALCYLGDYAEADRLFQQAGNFPLYKGANDFVVRVYLRRTWRGAEAALRLAERAAPNEPAGIEMRVRMLAELGRRAEAAKLLETVTEQQPLDVYAAAGMNDRARALAEAQLPDLRKSYAEFPEVPFNDSQLQRKEETRSMLIAAEMVLGHREAALSLLDAWWHEAEKRKPNRRVGGLFILNVPRYYAVLGQHDAAIEILAHFMTLGRSLGYDLRDSVAFAPLRDDPRFVKLRREAEAWAAVQPDPQDEPAASVQPKR
ncbi:MAG: protein kinase [Opitutaceae bacterium]